MLWPIVAGALPPPDGHASSARAIFKRINVCTIGSVRRVLALAAAAGLAAVVVVPFRAGTQKLYRRTA